jgi:hypothetical protein
MAGGARKAPLYTETLERYTQLSRYAIRHLDNTDLQSLTPVSIESALNTLRNSGGRKDEVHPLGRPPSARTVRHVAFVVHDSLEVAVRWGTLPTNPMDRVAYQSRKTRIPRRVTSKSRTMLGISPDILMR